MTRRAVVKCTRRPGRRPRCSNVGLWALELPAMGSSDAARKEAAAYVCPDCLEPVDVVAILRTVERPAGL